MDIVWIAALGLLWLAMLAMAAGLERMGRSPNGTAQDNTAREPQP